jgi:hypothetical protein
LPGLEFLAILSCLAYLFASSKATSFWKLYHGHPIFIFYASDHINAVLCICNWRLKHLTITPYLQLK